MLKKLLFVCLLSILPVVLKAQQGNTLTIHSTGAPVGTCAYPNLYIDDLTQNRYGCDSVTRTWDKIINAGGAVGGNGTPGALARFSATNTIADSVVFQLGSFIGVGTTTPIVDFQVSSTSTSDPRGIMSAQYTTDAIGARLQMRKARGTEASPIIIVTGDVLGRIRWSGYDGSNYLQMGGIEVGSSGTIAATRIPTYMTFATGTDAAPSVLTERIRIDNSGNVSIATSSMQSNTLRVKYDNTSSSIITSENANSGTGAFSVISSRNATSDNEGTALYTLGTGWTTTGLFLQDGGVLATGTNLLGGLSITARGANTSVRFSAGGVTTAQMTLLSTGLFGIGVTSPVSRLQVGGDLSASAWTTVGKAFDSAAATYTDTSTAAAGTVASRTANSFSAPTFASTNAITVTDGFSLTVAKPIQGTNTTLTRANAAFFDGPTLIGTIAFAALGAHTNGTQVYCSNCNSPTVAGTNNACATGGDNAGAFAIRIRGAWACF